MSTRPLGRQARRVSQRNPVQQRKWPGPVLRPFLHGGAKAREAAPKNTRGGFAAKPCSHPQPPAANLCLCRARPGPGSGGPKALRASRFAVRNRCSGGQASLRGRPTIGDPGNIVWGLSGRRRRRALDEYQRSLPPAVSWPQPQARRQLRPDCRAGQRTLRHSPGPLAAILTGNGNKLLVSFNEVQQGH